MRAPLDGNCRSQIRGARQAGWGLSRTLGTGTDAPGAAFMNEGRLRPTRHPAPPCAPSSARCAGCARSSLPVGSAGLLGE